MNIKFSNRILYPLSPLIPRTYQPGDVFVVDDDVGECVCCVLAQVGLGMISLMLLGNDTNRWREPVSVDNIGKISQEEFEKIRGNYRSAYLGRLESFLRLKGPMQGVEKKCL